MITTEQLVSANKLIKTTGIKGKQYAEVPQRIKAFRSICPNGAITTEIIYHDNGVCIIKATVVDEDGRILGTGMAEEKEGSTPINKTSYIENCETSAVGRALGMCGFGIEVAVASYEEVQNAIDRQQAMEAQENHPNGANSTGGKGGVLAEVEAKAQMANSMDELTAIYNTLPEDAKGEASAILNRRYAEIQKQKK